MKNIYICFSSYFYNLLKSMSFILYPNKELNAYLDSDFSNTGWYYNKSFNI